MPALFLLSDKPLRKGFEALGILKADVDNLGTIFSFGIKNKTISKVASLSRQLNYFFSLYLPYLLKNNKKYKNIYTVFAGGDDLFLIGPWNIIIDFSKELNEEFRLYVYGFCKSVGRVFET